MNKENEYNYLPSIGQVLKAYRKIMGQSQCELAEEINQYLRGIGNKSLTLRQSAIAKLEGDNMVPDHLILRFLYERILRTCMSTKMEIFALIDKIRTITSVTPNDIIDLFKISDLGEFKLFIEKNIAQSKDPSVARLNNFIFETELLPKLSDFSEIAFSSVSPSLSNIETNSTATLIVYLLYSYIQGVVDEKQALEYCIHGNVSSRRDFIKGIDRGLKYTKQEEPQTYEEIQSLGCFWDINASQKSKSKSAANMIALYKLYYFFHHFMGDIMKRMKRIIKQIGEAEAYMKENTFQQSESNETRDEPTLYDLICETNKHIENEDHDFNMKIFEVAKRFKIIFKDPIRIIVLMHSCLSCNEIYENTN